MLEPRGQLGRPTHCTDEVTELLTVQTQTQLGLIPKPTYVLKFKASNTAGTQSQACLRASLPWVLAVPACRAAMGAGSGRIQGPSRNPLGPEIARLKPKPDWPESQGRGADWRTAKNETGSLRPVWCFPLLGVGQDSVPLQGSFPLHRRSFIPTGPEDWRGWALLVAQLTGGGRGGEHWLVPHIPGLHGNQVSSRTGTVGR